jgi:hypothetical protein
MRVWFRRCLHGIPVGSEKKRCIPEALVVGAVAGTMLLQRHRDLTDVNEFGSAPGCIQSRRAREQATSTLPTLRSEPALSPAPT